MIEEELTQEELWRAAAAIDRLSAIAGSAALNRKDVPKLVMAISCICADRMETGVQETQQVKLSAMFVAGWMLRGLIEREELVI